MNKWSDISKFLQEQLDNHCVIAYSPDEQNLSFQIITVTHFQWTKFIIPKLANHSIFNLLLLNLLASQMYVFPWRDHLRIPYNVLLKSGVVKGKLYHNKKHVALQHLRIHDNIGHTACRRPFDLWGLAHCLHRWQSTTNQGPWTLRPSRRLHHPPHGTDPLLKFWGHTLPINTCLNLKIINIDYIYLE